MDNTAAILHDERAAKPPLKITESGGIMEDKEIIKLYYDRDEKALREVTRKYKHYCASIAENILGNHEDAEECFNDALMKTWETIPPKNPEYLSAYLAKITRNAALDKFKASHTAKRGGSKIEAVFDEISEFLESGDNVELTAERNAVLAEIDAFLQGLPEQKRRMFVLRYSFCESVGEIAKRFGVTENYVSVNLNRTGKKLAAHLRKRGYDT